uniref:Uncharacterized protein n=1 Tax=Anguilla anguilla TaxID=7936 RepID=A0A0E9UBJ4_ANGAN
MGSTKKGVQTCSNLMKLK